MTPTYAQTDETVLGEPPGICAFLGTDRLAAAIAEHEHEHEHEPDLVLHGPAHAGAFAGSIGEEPVYNVSIPVMQRDFWLIELDISKPTRAALHRGEHFVIVPEGLSERYPCATTVGGVDKPHVV